MMIRLLLVDDHDLLRSSLRVRLDLEHDLAPVGEAATAQQAIQQARLLQPDLVLLDLLLPRISGYEAIPDILRVAPKSRILVVSSQTSPTSVRHAITAGAHGYVAKRASDIELVAAARRIATGERYVDPALGADLVVPDEISALDPLTARERDILCLLALGYTNQEIGGKFFISVRTVDTHRANIMRKLELATRAELVLFALAHGLIGAR
jgi:DNA-binding NarL/FixJ family response regulator